MLNRKVSLKWLKNVLGNRLCNYNYKAVILR